MGLVNLMVFMFGLGNFMFGSGNFLMLRLMGFFGDMLFMGGFMG